MGENHLNPEPLADRHRTIFVLIDALGWQLL